MDYCFQVCLDVRRSSATPDSYRYVWDSMVGVRAICLVYGQRVILFEITVDAQSLFTLATLVTSPVASALLVILRGGATVLCRGVVRTDHTISYQSHTFCTCCWDWLKGVVVPPLKAKGCVVTNRSTRPCDATNIASKQTDHDLETELHWKPFHLHGRVQGRINDEHIDQRKL